MKKTFLAFAVATALGVASTARADTIVFSDDFNAENGAISSLNYTGFANWDVLDPDDTNPLTGVIDLISAADLGGVPTNSSGLFLDMDGSSGESGWLTSKNGLAALGSLAAGNYQLSFRLAGNQRNTGDEEQVSVLVTDDIGVHVSYDTYRMDGTVDPGDNSWNGPWNQPFTLLTQQFTLSSTTTLRLQFQGNGADNVGLLLDDIVLTRLEGINPTAVVPLPAAVWMGLLPLGGLAFARARSRRRRQAI